jgi:hypothetical protein
LETDRRQTAQIVTEPQHLAHALPSPVQDEHHRHPRAYRQLFTFHQRQFRQIDSLTARKKQHWRIGVTGNFPIDLKMLREINAFEPAGIGQTQVCHSAGTQPVLGLTRLTENHETGHRFERFEEPAIAADGGPAATRAPSAKLRNLARSV